MNTDQKNNLSNKILNVYRKYRISYEVPLIIALIMVFLLTVFILERNEYCNIAISEIIGNSSLHSIKYITILSFIILAIFVIKNFN